jgi:hypothetical protein
MDVVSLCPLNVSGFVWQSRSGAHALTVIVKATYLLQPGESELAPEQEARWPGRWQKLGRHAGSFPERGWEERPMPQDFDYQYFPGQAKPSKTRA